MDIKAANIPSHVPLDRVVDFDYNNPPELERGLHEAWYRLHDGPDIFWTPRNGGHWVITRGEDAEHVLKTYEIFSNHGLTVPKLKLPYRMLPLGEDPPESTPFRELIQPFFLPKAVATLEADARELAIRLIEGFRARGECEFVGEFAQHLPITIFLRMVDLPLEDRPRLLDIANHSTRGTTPHEREKANLDLMEYLEQWIVKRRANPGHDLISRIVSATINGRSISDADAKGTLSIVLFGGLDTVVSALGFVAHFLARNPEHRRQLCDDPALIPVAIEELLRRHGISGVGREVKRDTDYKGTPFRKGDLVWVNTAVYGLDDRKFDDPMKVDFKRRNTMHGAFGFGVHRCPGSFLARTELKVFLQEWLRRIPDFRIKSGAQAVIRAGSVSGVESLPLEWDV